jgi:hypothetical protein
MKTIEQIKAELIALTEQVNQLETVKDDLIHLTRKQLEDIINAAVQEVKDTIETEIRNIDLRTDDYVSVDLHDREIEVEFDSSSFLSDVIDNIDEFNNENTAEDKLDKLLSKFQ